MKLTKDGTTLFVALCALFVNKVGAKINKRSFGDHAALIAVRNKEGTIEKMHLVFRKTNVMTINPDNSVLPDVTSWYTRQAMNKLNKVLSIVNINLSFKKNTGWIIKDHKEQQTTFKNGELLDLSRPHGAAIYAQE